MIYASTGDILNRALSKLNAPWGHPERPEMSCGDIWKVSSTGILTGAEFDASNLFHSWYLTDWSHQELSGISMPAEQAYIEDLKAVAGCFGLSPEDVDYLLAEGFAPEELEEYFYCGNL